MAGVMDVPRTLSEDLDVCWQRAGSPILIGCVSSFLLAQNLSMCEYSGKDTKGRSFPFRKSVEEPWKRGKGKKIYLSPA